MLTNTYLLKEKLVNSKKTKSSTKSFVSSIVSILIALIVALLVATMMGYNPIYVLSKLFTVGFSDAKQLFNYIGIYVVAAFAFSMTSKAGVFNIGISGQMLASGTVIVFFTQILNHFGVADNIPNGVGQILILLIAMIVGALISCFIGSLSIYLKVNSVVSSILLNWIIYFISFYLLATSWDSIGYSPERGGGAYIVGSAQIPENFRLVDSVGGTGAIIPIVVIILIIAIAMIVLFKFTVFGHKINSVGMSHDASKYVGYSTNKIKLSVFVMSGAIAGILACINYTTGPLAMIPLNTSVESIPTEGFDGIAISLIANNNPIGILFIGGLFGLFKNSMVGITIPPSYFNVLIGLIMIGATLSILLIRFKPWQYLQSFRYSKQIFNVRDSYENELNENSIMYYDWWKVNYLAHKENFINACAEQLLLKEVDIKNLKQNNSDNKRELLAIDKKYDSEIKSLKKNFKINLKNDKKNINIEYINTKKIIRNNYEKEKIILLIKNKLSFNEMYQNQVYLITDDNNSKLSKAATQKQEKIINLEKYIEYNSSNSKFNKNKYQERILKYKKEIYDLEHKYNSIIANSSKEIYNKISNKIKSQKYIQSNINKINHKISHLVNEDDKATLNKYLNDILEYNQQFKEVK